MAIINNPHPILNNEYGNFTGFEFNIDNSLCTIQNGVYSFKFTASLDEDNLLSLLDNNDIEFVVEAVSKPFFSKIYKSNPAKPLEVNIEIPCEEAPSGFSFEFNALLITSKAIIYKNGNADKPMDLYDFNLEKNQIVAKHDPINISFERGYKEHNAGALIHIVKLKSGIKPENGTMDIKLSEDRNIIVSLAEDDYAKFIKMNSKDHKLLDCILTIPVLQYAIADLVFSNENRGTEWAVMLDEEFGIFELDQSMSEVLGKCDEILKSPIIPFLDYYDKQYNEND
jgi:hypothetical protein